MTTTRYVHSIEMQIGTDSLTLTSTLTLDLPIRGTHPHTHMYIHQHSMISVLAPPYYVIGTTISIYVVTVQHMNLEFGAHK